MTTAGLPPIERMQKRILVVDDDPLIRNLASTLLRRRNCSVAQAANGEEAIELLKASRDTTGHSAFDLVVLDLMMPKISGWEVLTFISTEFPQLTRHIVIVSAAGAMQLEKVQNFGCGDVLGKPFEAEEFYRRISRCMRGPVDPDFATGAGGGGSTLGCW